MHVMVFQCGTYNLQLISACMQRVWFNESSFGTKHYNNYIFSSELLTQVWLHHYKCCRKLLQYQGQNQGDHGYQMTQSHGGCQKNDVVI